ncbi:IST1 homolog [Clytia hemisphaerica]|eukprot:TCONS_00027887-protein
MFSGGFRGQKLKTSLRLSINRLKLMEKKKTELAQKARKEIADYITLNKYDRARIRVEHIIREDYLVEAMELIELYCDLLLARFGLIESMKYCDEGLVESVSTIIWASPRLSTDCAEIKAVADQLVFKYGKEFGQQARSNSNHTVNERLIVKLSPDPPPKILVERYLIEIARNYNVAFEPDPEVMMSEGIPSMDSKEFEALGAGGGLGFEPMGGPTPPGPPGNNSYPPPGGNSYPPPGGNPPPPGPPGGHSGGYGGGSGGGGGMAYPPPSQGAPYPPGDVPPYPDDNSFGSKNSGPAPPYTPGVNTGAPGNLGVPSAPGGGGAPGGGSINLPEIPTGSLHSNSNVGGQSSGGDDVDFDDLTRRFEELKKKK